MESTDTRAPVSLAVIATAIVVSSGEYLVRAVLGEFNEWGPLAPATVAIAAAASSATGLVARAGSPWLALLLGLVLAWAPFASLGIVSALTFGALFVATAGLFVRARPTLVTAVAFGCFLSASAHYYGS